MTPAASAATVPVAPTLRQVVLDAVDIRALAEFHRALPGVPDLAALAVVLDHARALGATVLLDRTGDADEPLWVFADPAGHPLCVFVAPDLAGV